MTSEDLIKSSLIKHGYTEEESKTLLKKHDKVVSSAIRLMSFTHYPVGQILEAEEHICTDDCPED